MMRVIAGSARRIQLRSIDSLETRPTTDRIKETLFNMIQFDIPGVPFLDLFAGSGSIGIEALSRGASQAVFGDFRKECMACIEENLRKTRLLDRAILLPGDYRTVLGRLRGRDTPFGFVFLDPPYRQGLALRALELLQEADYVDASTLFIVEAALEEDFSGAEGAYELVREKKYKTNKHLFFRLALPRA